MEQVMSKATSASPTLAGASTVSLNCTVYRPGVLNQAPRTLGFQGCAHWQPGNRKREVLSLKELNAQSWARAASLINYNQYSGEPPESQGAPVTPTERPRAEKAKLDKTWKGSDAQDQRRVPSPYPHQLSTRSPVHI